MLWVYDYYKYFSSYSAGIDFRRHNLCRRQIMTTKVYPRTVRGKCWLDVGPSSTTLAQHLASISETSVFAGWQVIRQYSHLLPNTLVAQAIKVGWPSGT